MYSLPIRPYRRCGYCENNNNNNKVDFCTPDQLNKIRSLGYFYFILVFTKACHFNPYFWTVPCHCHWWTQATNSSLAAFCSTLLTTHYSLTALASLLFCSSQHQKVMLIKTFPSPNKSLFSSSGSQENFKLPRMSHQEASNSTMPFPTLTAEPTAQNECSSLKPFT